MPQAKRTIPITADSNLEIVFPLPKLVMDALQRIERNSSDQILPWNRIGRGYYGYVFEHLDVPSFVVKKFNEGSFEELFKRKDHGNNHRYDYEVLQDLQGISEIPILYAYVPEHYVVMSRAKGISVRELALLPSWNDQLKELIEEKIQCGVRKCIKQGWMPQDFKPRHVYYDVSSESVMFLDVGRFSPVTHLINKGLTEEDMFRQAMREYQLNVALDPADKYPQAI